MKIKFTKYRKFYYGFSAILFLASLFSIIFLGIIPGIEFVGGSALEVEYSGERPETKVVEEQLREAGLKEIGIQPLGEKGFLITTEKADEDAHRTVLGILEGAEEVQFESIGPSVGEELKNMSIIAIILSSLLIIVYLAISFREEESSTKSLKYGIIATGVVFLHDVFIVLGLFSFLGYFYGVQVTIPIAVALLTILGYSINDTVVIFDRIRENLRKNKSGIEKLDVVIDKSLNETMGRSLGTSLTTLFVLFSLLFFGGTTLYYFVLALIVGIILGTYSSLFLAGSLILDWDNLTKRRK